MHNVVLLSILLLINIIIIALVMKKDYMSISFWAASSFFIASSLYSIFFSYFGRDIHEITIIVIQLAVLSFFVGERIGKKYLECLQVRDSIASISRPVLTEKRVAYLFSCIILVYGIMRFYKMYEFSIHLGNVDILNTVRYIRRLVTWNGPSDFGVEMEWYTRIGNSILKPIPYMFIFYYLYNKIKCNIRKKYLLFPVYASLFAWITDTGRAIYIQFFCWVIGISFILYYSTGISSSNGKKFLKYATYLLVSMVVIFYGYGMMFRESIEESNRKSFLSIFCCYYSAGIYGLNDYLENPWSESDYFGSYTLSPVYSDLNRVFDTNYNIIAHHFKLFYFYNGTGDFPWSNIYSSLTPLIQDYGIFGMSILIIIIGCIYGGLAQYLYYCKFIHKHLILVYILGKFFYIAIMIPVAERFFYLFVTHEFFVSVCMLLILDYIYCHNTVPLNITENNKFERKICRER